MDYLCPVSYTHLLCVVVGCKGTSSPSTASEPDEYAGTCEGEKAKAISEEMCIRDRVKIIKYNYDNFDGFVILHGTDTMAYTASALSFMLRCV